MGKRSIVIFKFLVLSFVFVLAVLFARPTSAQGQSPNEHEQLQQLHDDISTLKRDINKLETERVEMLDQFNQLKQLITARTTVSPSAPQPPAILFTLPTHDETFRGSSGASVAIVEYADFECPYCGQYEHDIYPQISKDYIQTGKVKYFFRDLPLPMHPHAMIAARAARCAGEQGKYWEMNDSLFAKQNAIREADMPERAHELGLDSAKFSECLSSNRYVDDINQSAVEAQKMGIGGTPTFFVGKLDSTGGVTNLKMIVGARPYDAFKSVIDGLLAEQGSVVPGSGHLDGK
jgi:protein-disulfide isomerase